MSPEIPIGFAAAASVLLQYPLAWLLPGIITRTWIYPGLNGLVVLALVGWALWVALKFAHSGTEAARLTAVAVFVTFGIEALMTIMAGLFAPVFPPLFVSPEVIAQISAGSALSAGNGSLGEFFALVMFAMPVNLLVVGPAIVFASKVAHRVRRTAARR